MSRRGSRDELMQDANLPTPVSPVQATFAYNPAFNSPMMPAHPAMSPSIGSPNHSPTSAVFPTSVPYHSPYPSDMRQSLLMSHHRSHSDTSMLSLKGLTAPQMGMSASMHVPGHHRSRTTLDGSLQMPQLAHSLSSAPVSPMSLGQIPELPFLRSISHGNLSNLNYGDFPAERRPASAGVVQDQFTALGFEEQMRG
jgi:hypothetical protein